MRERKLNAQTNSPIEDTAAPIRQLTWRRTAPDAAERTGLALLVLATGIIPVLVTYVIGWIILPKENERQDDRSKHR